MATTAFLRFSRNLAALSRSRSLKPLTTQLFTRQFSLSAIQRSDRKYSEEHEWVSISGNVGTVGLSHHAQDSLGEIVYVELPEEGASFDKDETVGAVESVKAANDIFTPVSGTIAGVNSTLVDKPDLINTSCYEEGWMFKIELSNPSELDSLMDEEAYKNFLKSQED